MGGPRGSHLDAVGSLLLWVSHIPGAKNNRTLISILVCPQVVSLDLRHDRFFLRRPQRLRLGKSVRPLDCQSHFTGPPAIAFSRPSSGQTRPVFLALLLRPIGAVRDTWPSILPLHVSPSSAVGYLRSHL